MGLVWRPGKVLTHQRTGRGAAGVATGPETTNMGERRRSNICFWSPRTLSNNSLSRSASRSGSGAATGAGVGGRRGTDTDGRAGERGGLLSLDGLRLGGGGRRCSSLKAPDPPHKRHQGERSDGEHRVTVEILLRR